MGIFSFLFNGSKSESESRYRLTHPKYLREGDIIKFGFLPQKDLSNKKFEVAKVNTYIFDGLYYPEAVLKDADGCLFYLMVEEEDGEEYLSVSKKFSKIEMLDLLNDEGVEKVVKGELNARITPIVVPEKFSSWVKDFYNKSDSGVKGDFAKGDMRETPLEMIKGKEGFTSYTLIHRSDKYALEFELYNTYEMELCATIYLESDQIEDMWPGSFGK